MSSLLTIITSHCVVFSAIFRQVTYHIIFVTFDLSPFLSLIHVFSPFFLLLTFFPVTHPPHCFGHIRVSAFFINCCHDETPFLLVQFSSYHQHAFSSLFRDSFNPQSIVSLHASFEAVYKFHNTFSSSSLFLDILH